MKEPEVRDSGIFCDLGGGWWILFTKVWGSSDRDDYQRSDNLVALRLIVERALDWRIPDLNWNPIPFDKPKLLEQIDGAIRQQLENGQVSLETTARYATYQALDKLAQENAEVKEALAPIVLLVTQATSLVNLAKDVLLPADKMFVIPTQLQVALTTAVYEAIGASYSIPFDSVCPST